MNKSESNFEFDCIIITIITVQFLVFFVPSVGVLGEIDPSASGQGPVAGPCGHDNESACSIKRQGLTYYKSNGQLSKNRTVL
jgi:hypothetical protein